MQKITKIVAFSKPIFQNSLFSLYNSGSVCAFFSNSPQKPNKTMWFRL